MRYKLLKCRKGHDRTNPLNVDKWGACVECSRQWHKSHPTSITAHRRFVLKRREYIRQFKTKPCKDCGRIYPFWIMQFDHLRDKKFDVSRSITTLDKLNEEISKCEVVCANCHANRTYSRMILKVA